MTSNDESLTVIGAFEWKVGMYPLIGGVHGSNLLFELMEDQGETLKLWMLGNGGVDAFLRQFELLPHANDVFAQPFHIGR